MNAGAEGKNYQSLLRESLVELKKMQFKLEASENAKREAIAIVGMSCRFPGADSPDAFWELQQQGKDVIAEVPASRWDIHRYYDSNPKAPGKICTRSGGFVEAVDQFEPQFFGISPREATNMDPQQRLLLEVSWEALERANVASDTLFQTAAGVFIGICSNDYAQLLEAQGEQKIEAYQGTGKAYSVAAGRLSYTLGLNGPAIAVDTACSSSLVAVHLAVQSLRQRECNLALAGGVNLLLTPYNSIVFSQSRMLSPDGRCKTFDASANGFARSEGCGVIVLKRLSDALASGDRILALIRGTGVNQDGASSGLTVPNGSAQEAVIRQALVNGQVEPSDVDYVEAHGTGTSLGDPIEVRALGAVFGNTHSLERPLLIGSVKTNIGHAEAAAGIAGLIKVVLALQHKQLLPHLHLNQPNPYINWEQLPVKLLRELTPWFDNGKKRFAGVSSFGFSGTNAHVVLEEAPVVECVQSEFERPLHLLAMSAKSETALQQLVQRYEEHLTTYPELSLPDISFSVNTGRSHFRYRLAVVAASTQELVEKLATDRQQLEVVGIVYGKQTSTTPKVAFLFTGQGSQYVGMGRQLYETQPIFRKALHQCEEILRTHFELPLLNVLYPEVGTDSTIHQTAYTQPALFALEYALAQLWLSWGIQPSVVLGHSVGEYVAACIAGVFSLEEGLKLIAARGRLMQQLPCGGAMVAVMASETQVRPLLEPYTDTVAIAAINGPENVVISGDAAAVEKIVAKLEAARIKVTPLQVSHAFHSPLMKPILAEFERVASGISYNSPSIPIVSNVTGQLADNHIATAGYWVRHVCQPVQFAASMQTLQQQGYGVFVEIGPRPILLGMGRQCLPDEGQLWLASLRPPQLDWSQMLESLAQLYVLGVQVDWGGFDKDYTRRKVILPTYPFQRQRYWVESPSAREFWRAHTSKSLHPLLGQQIQLANSNDWRFESQLSAAQPAYLQDHKVFSLVIFPGAAYIEMALAAFKQLFKSKAVQVEEVFFCKALVLKQTEPDCLQTIITQSDDSTYQFQIYSLQTNNHPETQTEWQLHTQGKLRVAQGDINPTIENLETYQAQCSLEQNVNEYYQQFQQRGIDYGTSFQGIQKLWQGNDCVLGQLQLPPQLVTDVTDYHLHPALLDAAFQVACSAIKELLESERTYVPIEIERFALYRPPSLNLWVVGRLSKQAEDSRNSLTVQLTLLNTSKEVVAIVQGLRLKQTTAQVFCENESDVVSDWFYEVEWRQKARFGQLQPPEFLLAPTTIEHQLRSSWSELVTQAELKFDANPLPQLEKLSLEYVLLALVQMGWRFQIGEEFSSESAAQRLRVVPQHQRLLARWLQMLAEAGILRYNLDQNNWVVLQPLPKTNPQTTAQSLEHQFPTAQAELTLLNRCGSQLSAVLRGAVDPVQLIFPKADLSAATKLYQDSPTAKTYNTLVQQAVTTALSNAPQNRGIRLLEIGAGTGGTTSYLLPHLSPSQVEYTFTDIGALFINQAQERFAEYPFVRYQVLDIELDPTAQRFDAHQYDIIIAANVLHATSSISQTLEHVRKLLAPGGLLVLLEATAPQRWVDLTFGLLEGWWRFSDLQLRRDYPLLGVEQWQQVLHSNGFEHTISIPQQLEPLVGLSQQAVIVAQASRLQPLVEQTKAAKNWLVLVDQLGVGQQLIAQLQAQGDVCICVTTGQHYQQLSQTEFTFNPEHPEDYQQLLEQVAINTSTLHGVVHCLPLRALQTSAVNNGTELEAQSRLGCGTTLMLVQALAKASLSHRPRLWLVTRGAQLLPQDHPQMSAIGQSSLWGMKKVIALEHPEFHCTCVDLDPNATINEQAIAMLAEVCSLDLEDQVLFRSDARYVARLTRSRSISVATTQQLPFSPFSLTTTGLGTLENLKLEPKSRRFPNSGEVEIHVRATGLNFRDVLIALDIYPGTPIIGGECAGEIVSVGEDVEGFAVGDAVVALAPGSFSQYVTVRAEYVALKPTCLSFEEAAALPVNYLTAYYTLHHLAKIKAGERVLIHAAAGGTGMAAVQIALQAQAEVFATASPQKWEALRSIGVRHIMNSRTTGFAVEVMQMTEGRGVDIVLNSLTSGDFVSKSLSVLNPQGRFVEIAKRGAWDSKQVRAQRPDVSYTIVDLIQLSQEQPHLIQSLLTTIVKQFSSGLFSPPPLQIFPITRAIDAFRHMQHAKHIGKIVVSQVAGVESATALSCHPEGTYLITGGLGGLGLLVARWLVERGAKHLVLLTRRSPNAVVQTQLQSLKQTGVRIEVVQADVSNYDSLVQAFCDIQQSLPPLRGIIHSAGVLDDATLQQQTWEKFAKVMAPKVQGAWYLHQLTQTQPLDFFVMFSSAASLLGSPGQANHSAANAFLDVLAHYRRSLGLVGQSIHWGAVSQIGEAAERGADILVQRRGMGVISPQQTLQALELVLANPTVVEVGVVPIQWAKLLQQWEGWSLLSDFQQPSTATTVVESEFVQQLKNAAPHQQQEMLTIFVQKQVAKVLGIQEPQQIELRQGFFALGMDSLTSVELRNRLQTSLGCSISASLAFTYPTVEALVNYLLLKVFSGTSQSQSIELVKTDEHKAWEDATQFAESEVDASITKALNKIETLLKKK